MEYDWTHGESLHELFGSMVEGPVSLTPPPLMDPKNQVNRLVQLFLEWDISLKVPNWVKQGEEPADACQRLLIIPKGMDGRKLSELIGEEVEVVFDLDEDDVKKILSSDNYVRKPKETYAVWVNNTPKPVVNTTRTGEIGTTLLEEILCQYLAWREIGERLSEKDENEVICFGSRFQNGLMPLVYWGVDGKMHIADCGEHDIHDLSTFREVRVS